jgi:UvrD/REP helicase N-terminal domain
LRWAFWRSPRSVRRYLAGHGAAHPGHFERAQGPAPWGHSRVSGTRSRTPVTGPNVVPRLNSSEPRQVMLSRCRTTNTLSVRTVRWTKSMESLEPGHSALPGAGASAHGLVMNGQVTPKLTGEARRAVKHRGSHLQIIATAGSGKTEVVSQWVADPLVEGVLPSQIVASLSRSAP